MTFTDQLKKLKNNWLVIVLVIIGLLFVSQGNITTKLASYESANSFGSSVMYDGVEENYRTQSIPLQSPDFAPEIEERKLTKTTSLSSEIARGTFSDQQALLHSIIATHQVIMLNEQVNVRDSNHPSYYGSYQMKVPVENYDAVIAQLKQLGDVQSFVEQTQDITGQYESADIRLAAEKSRLQRYEELYTNAESVDEKLKLSDRIFNQERTVKYLEDSINLMDKKIDYSTVTFTLSETRSSYARVSFVKFSELVTTVVGSINVLFLFISLIVPWLILGGLVYGGVRLIQHKR